MSVYSTEEKIEIIKWYYSGSTAQEIVGRFAFSFENRPIPCESTIFNIIKKFETAGCVVNCKKCAHHNEEPVVRPLSEERERREIAVCSLAEINFPCNSTTISEEVDIGARTVRNILKRNKYKCYKLQTTQEIFPEDFEKRSVFCVDVMERANRDDRLISHILFTDESSFSLHGHHNPSVAVGYSRENNHISIVGKTQYPQKVNVWAGILGNSIIGPFFIEGNLNANKYLELLRNQIIPAVRALPINFNEIWYQHDGCPAHNAEVVQTFLTETFPDHMISRRGTILWPPRSPDLAPNDFFLWGHITQEIYGHQHERANNLDELKGKIRQSLIEITPDVLENVLREFYDRLGYCLAQNGGLFENLLH